MGQSVARYFIHDGMRGIDYLVSRSDVDPDRIGAMGCSGGGTQTTYIAALDERVKAAAVACYMNSFQTLFTGSIGDSEQSLPGFLAAGLDQTDYVELFAPKPWLIASTEGDLHAGRRPPGLRRGAALVPGCTSGATAFAGSWGPAGTAHHTWCAKRSMPG